MNDKITDAMVQAALGPLPADHEGRDDWQVGFNSAMQIVREELPSALEAAFAAAPKTEAQAAGDRTRFEQWVRRRHGADVGIWHDTGNYQSYFTRAWWECWNEALATPASHDAQQPVSAGMERLVRAVTAARRERDEKEVLSSSTMGEMWLALEALVQQPAVVGDGATAWKSIDLLPNSDDLFWFARGDTVDGPRPPQHGGYDADEWDLFAPAEAPPFAAGMAAITHAATPTYGPKPAVVGDWVCAEADMQMPWGAESAFLRHLADDSALNAAQSMMLRHCAKRIESTAGIHLRALADMLDPAKQAGVLREAADALTPAATPGADLVGEDGLRLPTLDGFLGLNPDTLALVRRFAYALACKLSVAEQKYGYTDGWKSPDWMDECRQKLVEHVTKGDPRDVAAYCAFLWHHGESTAATPRPACPDCKGTGGEWWMEADGSENGRKCDTCDGFGSVAMPCSKCADLDRANKQLHDHGTAMYAQLTALRSALVEYPKKNPQQMQAAKVCAGVMKLAAQKEGNGNG